MSTRSPIARIVSLALALGVAAVAPTGCESQAPPPANDGKLVVVASIHPLAAIAEAIVGDAGEVHTLLPPGVSPHGYAPTPRDMVALGAADVLLVAGRGLDDWAHRTGRRLRPDAEVVRLGGPADDDHEGEHEGPDHHEEGHADHDHHGDAHDHDPGHAHDHGHEHHHAEQDTGGHDHHDHTGPNPHLWLDPHVVRGFADAVAESIKPFADASLHEGIDRRLADFQAEVDRVDGDYASRLAGVARREMVTFHNAFDPLAERYGLEVVAHLSPIDVGGAGEVTPARLNAAAEAIAAHGVPAVYIEPQLPDAVARRLADKAGVAVLTLDPLGHPDIEGRRTWAELMSYNLDVLVEGQSTDAGSPPD